MWKKAEKFLLKDKYIGPLIKKYGPCKIKPAKKKNYFVDLVETIASQQLSYKAALTIFNRIKEKAGGEITAENILGLKDKEIRACGMSWAKASYVKDLAQRVKSNKLQITKLDKLSDEEVTKELVAVKGIGLWSAKMVLMFTLARPDIFPTDDLGIKNGMKRLLKRGLKPQKLAKFAERWKPYRTVASWYIWRNLENR
ncbi:DNA-3-methyladenine glycosylase 2 family protein [Candidatus Woesebacteria bacterium]|nr:DNA-3-methyladenine glycosylase 2 family protein [Candidatus Woesebacteria bacterium]